MVFERHYEALLQMADIMVRHRSLPALFSELAKALHKVIAFEVASLALHDPEKQVMRLHIWEGPRSVSDPAEVQVETSSNGWVWENQQLLVVPDLQLEARFPGVSDLFRDRAVRSCCVMPLTTARTRLGALGLGSSQVNAYQEEDLRLLQRVAELVALALGNSLAGQALQEEKGRLQALLDLNQVLASSLELQQLCPTIAERLQRVMRVDHASLALCEPHADGLRVYASSTPVRGLK